MASFQCGSYNYSWRSADGDTESSERHSFASDGTYEHSCEFGNVREQFGNETHSKGTWKLQGSDVVIFSVEQSAACVAYQAPTVGEQRTNCFHVNAQGRLVEFSDETKWTFTKSKE